MERLETDQREEVGPQPTVNKQEVFSVKQEVEEGHMMLEAAFRAEISSQQEAKRWTPAAQNTEEEQQVRGWSFSLHIKQEEGGASGPEETDTKFTQGSDWLMESYDGEGSSSSNHIQFHREEDLLPAPSDHLIRPQPGGTCRPADHSRDSLIQSESSTEDSDDTKSEPDLQRTGTRPPADQRLLVCGSCGREFSSKRTLSKQTCSSIKKMEIHKRVHTGEKPYQCWFCRRDFSRKESLERHLKVHCGDRPHCCGLCRRTFTRREHLVHHLKTDHTERPGLPAGTET